MRAESASYMLYSVFKVTFALDVLLLLVLSSVPHVLEAINYSLVLDVIYSLNIHWEVEVGHNSQTIMRFKMSDKISVSLSSHRGELIKVPHKIAILLQIIN